MISINDFNPKNIKVDERSFKDHLFYYNGYEKSAGIKP